MQKFYLTTEFDHPILGTDDCFSRRSLLGISPNVELDHDEVFDELSDGLSDVRCDAEYAAALKEINDA